MDADARGRHVTLVGPEIEENLGLRYVAASLERAGHTTDLVVLQHEAEVVARARAIAEASPKPLLVAVSLAFQSRAHDYLAFVVALRELGYAGHVTAGGHFASCAATEVLEDFPELDSVCLYEADHVVVELVAALERGSPLSHVPGLVWRNQDGRVTRTEPAAPPDLDALPWPDRRGPPQRCLGHAVAPIAAGRGCFGRCAFCCIATMHASQGGGQRQRLRSVASVADEMAWLRKHRDVDVFVFNDDNFFPPGRDRALARVHALGDALDARNVGRIAAVLRARPPDVTPELARAIRDRLGCIRVFLGIDTNTAAGLAKLRPGVSPAHNEAAIAALREAGVYTTCNMLLFDLDTTLDGLRENLAFMGRHVDMPMNFGRVELYAGTPVLSDALARGRARGDYLRWDYDQPTPDLQRVYERTMRCFAPRNFGLGSVVNRLMGMRFRLELIRHLHGDRLVPAWKERAGTLTQELMSDTLTCLDQIMDLVDVDDDRCAAELASLASHMRSVDASIADTVTTLDLAMRSLPHESRDATPHPQAHP